MEAAFKYAFQKTIPIMAGFTFLGMTYGIYMHQLGFNFLFPTLMAATIFGGSVEFVVANLLLKSFSPWTVLFLTLIINSRHLFYGISMLDRYHGTGWKKFFLIFGMCDETFSINFVTKVPETVDYKLFMLWVTLLNYFYWVLGACLGGLLGGLITVKLNGIDFVMVALFLVLFANQYFNEDEHFSSILGIVVAVVALFLTGPTYFLPVSMLAMVAILWWRYQKEARYDLD